MICPQRGAPVLIALTVRRLASRIRRAGCGRSLSRSLGLTQRHTRRTMLLRRLLEVIALALAGRAASRLPALLGVGVCRDTLIQLVRALPDPGIGQVTVLGVDDFPKRRGHSYAILIIEMDTRKPVDVLDDREASSLAGWPREHPACRRTGRPIMPSRSNVTCYGSKFRHPTAEEVDRRLLTEIIRR
jgi:hypothetical protein